MGGCNIFAIYCNGVIIAFEQHYADSYLWVFNSLLRSVAKANLSGEISSWRSITTRFLENYEIPENMRQYDSDFAGWARETKADYQYIINSLETDSGKVITGHNVFPADLDKYIIDALMCDCRAVTILDLERSEIQWYWHAEGLLDKKAFIGKRFFKLSEIQNNISVMP